MNAKFKLQLFWCETPKQSLIILLGWKDLIWSLTLIWWIFSIAWRSRDKKFKLLNWSLSSLVRIQRRWSIQSICSLGIERFQISTINSKTSLFQVEGSNVGQNLQINLCNLLYLVFLCNFRFKAFISLFLGAFNAF